MDLSIILAIAGGLVVAWFLFLGLLWVFRPKDVPFGEALRIVPDILRMGWGILGDPAAPRAVRFWLLILVAWLVSPIDLVPEFLPVIGPLDDLVVAVLVLRYVRRRLGDAELHRRWPGTNEGYALLSAILR